MYSMRTLREPHSGRNQTPPSLRQVNTTLQGHPMRTSKKLRHHKLTRLVFAVLLLCSSLANPLAIAAHAMGNFSISHYAGLCVAPRFIELRYIIEIHGKPVVAATAVAHASTIDAQPSQLPSVNTSRTPIPQAAPAQPTPAAAPSAPTTPSG